MLSKEQRKLLPNSKFTVNFSDFIHLYPCLILLIENFFWKFEIQQNDIIIPFGYLFIYHVFNIYRFFVYNVQPYEILNWRKSKGWIVIISCYILLYGLSSIFVILRHWINNQWV